MAPARFVFMFFVALVAAVWPSTTAAPIPARFGRPPSTTSTPTQDATAPTSTQAPGSDSSAPAPDTQASGSDPAIQQYLDGHNTVRRNHGAPDLVWDDAAAAASQRWANNCKFEHEGSGPYGENLAAGTNLDIRGGIQLWADEVADYNPSNPQYPHFTQVVWKGTTGVGCASAQCNSMLGSGAATFYVCKYSPPGNVIGQFEANVQVLARNEWEPGSRVTNEALLLYQV